MAHETFLNTVQTTKAITIIATAKTIRKVLVSSAMELALFAPVQCAHSGYSPRQLILACGARTVSTSIQDATASGGISGRLSITLSTKPKSLAISAVIK